jgi:hypothetical protein
MGKNMLNRFIGQTTSPKIPLSSLGANIETLFFRPGDECLLKRLSNTLLGANSVPAREKLPWP